MRPNKKTLATIIVLLVSFSCVSSKRFNRLDYTVDVHRYESAVAFCKVGFAFCVRDKQVSQHKCQAGLERCVIDATNMFKTIRKAKGD